MSHPKFAETAVDSQLVASLDAYERELGTHSPEANDSELVTRVDGHFQRIRRYASVLAQSSVSWGSMLISRAEFTRGVWTRAPQATRDLLRNQHREAVREMHERCVSLKKPK